MGRLQFTFSPKWTSATIFFLGLAAFLQSTIWMKAFLVFNTKIFLSPYNFGFPTAETLLNVTEWELAINDFFWTMPGVVLPAAIAITIQVILFLTKMATARYKQWIPLWFAFTNAAFIIVTFLLFLVAYLPNLLSTRSDLPAVNYWGSLPGIIVTTGMLMFMFWMQWKLDVCATKVRLSALWEKWM